MKKGRLFILIFAMLISLASVGCGTSEDVPEIETETETETETEVEAKRQNIKTSIAVKYSEKEINLYSDTTCFLNLSVTIRDGDFVSEEGYGEFQLTEGEVLTLTISDLNSEFFSDEAIIEYVNTYEPYVYGDTPISEDNFTNVDSNLLIKYSTKEVIIYSDTTCFFDLTLYVNDSGFLSDNTFRKLEIAEGETITLTLDDLAPGFFSDTAVIYAYNQYTRDTYVEKN